MLGKKIVTLRAFEFGNMNVRQNTINIMELLADKLRNTTVEERRMLLNKNDNEEDLICDYSLNKHFVFATLLRIKHREDVPNIPDNLFTGNKFVISTLDKLEIDSSLVYKDHFYFLLNNQYVVTNLTRTIGISRLQTYINYILEEEREDRLYELTPLIQDPPEYKLSDLNKIKIQDPNISVDGDNGDNTIEESQRTSLGISSLISLLSHVNSIDIHKLDTIVSAELLLKFKKPRKMSQDDYQRAFGAYMKPITETDNVTFYPKKGIPIKGSDILKTKSVEVELTQSRKLSEKHLKQEMENFLKELLK